MTDTTPILSELEEDLLKELFNLGIGKAAATLSRMINQEVSLSVPTVRFHHCDILLSNIKENTAVASISQTLKGKFSGEAVLLFPENSSLQVVKLLLGSKYSDEVLADLKQEALLEIGNIVLNACVGSIAQTLESDFSLDIPQYNLVLPENVPSIFKIASNESILLINIDLRLQQSNVSGYLAFIFGPMSIMNLHDSLKMLLNKLYNRIASR